MPNIERQATMSRQPKPRDYIAEGQIWAQRIGKENEVNAKRNNQFRVVKPPILITDKFSCYATNKCAPGESQMNKVDPIITFPPHSEEGKLLSQTIARTGPRQRFFVPQTSYQEHGWLQAGMIEGLHADAQKKAHVAHLLEVVNAGLEDYVSSAGSVGTRASSKRSSKKLKK